MDEIVTETSHFEQNCDSHPACRSIFGRDSDSNPGFWPIWGHLFWQIRLEQTSIYNLQAALAVQAGLAVLAAQAVLPEVT